MGKWSPQCIKGPPLDICLEPRYLISRLRLIKYQAERITVTYLSNKIFLEVPKGTEKNLLGRLFRNFTFIRTQKFAEFSALNMPYLLILSQSKCDAITLI